MTEKEQPLMERDMRMQAAMLDLLPAHIALLDVRGVTVWVNEAWKRFASDNGCKSSDFAVGLK